LPASPSSQIGPSSHESGSARPSSSELELLFEQKYGSPCATGWSPRRRHDFGYYLPADVYEALLSRLITNGCRWLDVGGGRHIFPDNSGLSQTLADRAKLLVAVDPSNNVQINPYVHERVQCLLEDYRTDHVFDVATLRMVAEHVVDPERLVAALKGLVRPGGVVVIFTVNGRSPLPLLSRVIPFGLHHPIKRLFWGGEEEDTFPVAYRMNSRATLKRLFESDGFHEILFSYLDDLSTLGHFKLGISLELVAWRLLKSIGIRYPETCLLGVYQKPHTISA
jgi:SAM-dependent methyltransferase